MKKITGIMLVIALMLGMTTATFANVIPSSKQSCYTISEFDMLETLAKESKSELKQDGYSQEEIAEIKEYETLYQKHIEELGNLSDERLRNWGYSEEELSIIRNFQGTTEEMRALSAKVTINITDENFKFQSKETYTTGTLNYSWNWTKKPMSQATDLIAFAWNDWAVKASSSYVKYYDMTTGVLTKGEPAQKIQPTSVVSGVGGNGYKFPLVQGNLFAKEGNGYFKLQSDVHIAKDCYYGMAYGHTTLALSVGYSIGKSGLDPTFAFKSGIENMASINGCAKVKA